MLAGIVSLDVFLGNLQLKRRRVFRDAIWGFEIIESARRVSNTVNYPWAENPPDEPSSFDLSNNGAPSRPSKSIARLSVDDL